MVGQKAPQPRETRKFSRAFFIPEWLSFDDVLLVPKYSRIFKDEVGVGTKLTKNITLKIPLIASPIPRIKVLLAAGADVIILDSAHGHADYIIKATRSIKRKYPQVELVSGNVGNAEGFENLAKAGADAVRVGVGPGSICTTRIVSGVGAPQLSAIMDCAKVSRKYNVGLIADGGIKQAGDIVKALAAGAWTVMIGSLFARLKEAPGKVVTIKGKKYKYYRGMGSVPAMKKGSAGRYGQLMHAKRLVAEGVEGLVPYKGELKDFIFQLMGGVKSGMEVESHPHDVLITNGGESYH